MKRPGLLLMLLLALASMGAHAQNSNFKLEGNDHRKLTLEQSFLQSTEITPFESNGRKTFGMAIDASITFQNASSYARVILLDTQFNEYLIYENYPYLSGSMKINVEQVCEETALLHGVQPYKLRIELQDAELELAGIYLANKGQVVSDLKRKQKEKKQAQNRYKVEQLNKHLRTMGQGWIAGGTSISELSYADRKKLYGNGTFPSGFEFYAGGVISSGNSSSLKSASSSSLFVPEWDWRNRHGRNWITPVKNQELCGACWAFAAAGATEAMFNVFYNQVINLDLSEQDLLSCSGAGSCDGGYPGTALNYISSTGVVDENCFPYTALDENCSSKGSSPNTLVKISGKVDFGSSLYPKTDDDLKRMLIEMGPISGGLLDWSHAMVLTGYKTVEAGDTMYYRDLSLSRYWKVVEAGDPLIGKTVWIFKNSWGKYSGDQGYVYVETPISNFRWTHAIKTPLTSEIQQFDVVCEDRDGDGYYYWGIGPKPANCPDCPDLADGDDSNPNLGPLDEFGYCILLNGAPVANFSSETIIKAEQNINFIDQSLGNPSTWVWNFPGGTPASSNEQNPVITYNTPGTYAVSLSVTNANGSDTKVLENYITVESNEVLYCQPVSNADNAWIASVQLGENSNSSSRGDGYQDFTSTVFSLNNGASHAVKLSPGFSGRSKFQYWGIWIDFNGDKDFSDAGEKVFQSSKSKSIVSGSITVPQNLEMETRLRIVMGNTPPSDCGNIESGQVEDYTVHLFKAAELPPVAEFTVNTKTVLMGESVQFSNASSNNPDGYQWYFPGGTPSSSTELNPVVTYAEAGSFDVTLIAYKEGFTDCEKLESAYIVVNNTPSPSEYCTPINVNSSRDFISAVNISGVVNSVSGGDGYSFDSTPFAFGTGSSYSVELTPSQSKSRNFWRIWIDFNKDGDFDDADESMVVLNNKRGNVSGTITIPGYATGATRMRISMKTGKAPAPCEDGFSGEVEDYLVDFGTQTILKQAEIPISIAPEPNRFGVYPNPTKDMVHVQLNAFDAGTKLMLFNSVGSKIKELTISSSLTSIDLRDQASGIYFIVVNSQQEQFKEKIIKR